MSQKPSIPKGTRDILPAQMVKRNYIFDTIKSTFQKFGYEQIETPSFEKTETLMGKYGDEGDKLIFKILNSGDFKSGLEAYVRAISYLNLKALNEGLNDEDNQKLNKLKNKIGSNKFVILSNNIDQIIFDNKGFGYDQIADKCLASLNSSDEVRFISEKALKYDLTVPFARFVVQNFNELTFPFKRYQIQPVWRADNPQKGRYREFFQCDADVVGSDSLLHEVDFVLIFNEVLRNFNIPNFSIKLNNRKVLAGVAEVIGESEKLVKITVAIDKLDKIGVEGVQNELKNIGLSDEVINKLDPLFNLSGGFDSKMDQMTSFLANSEIGMKGLEELKFVYSKLDSIGFDFSVLDFDVTLARGLNYYTGCIFEVGVSDVQIGSICGGGRYDDLTGVFGMKGLSGVGISFGADRIFDVLEELNLFPSTINEGSQILFINFGGEEEAFSFESVFKLRSAGIKAELYPDAVKMKKQMKFANDKSVPFVAMAGSEEIKTGSITVKNMETGDQESLSIEELIKKLA